MERHAHRAPALRAAAGVRPQGRLRRRRHIGPARPGLAVRHPGRRRHRRAGQWIDRPAAGSSATRQHHPRRYRRPDPVAERSHRPAAARHRDGRLADPRHRAAGKSGRGQGQSGSMALHDVGHRPRDCHRHRPRRRLRGLRGRPLPRVLRGGRPHHPVPPGRPLAWLAGGRQRPLLALVAVAVVLAASLPWLAAEMDSVLYNTLVFSFGVLHFWFDGRIWKLRRPAVAATFGIAVVTGRPPSPAASRPA